MTYRDCILSVIDYKGHVLVALEEQGLKSGPKKRKTGARLPGS
jgi:hypothetical protein